LGIDNLSNGKSYNINLYPNPANNFITISTENIDENLVFEVYDVVGKSITKGVISKYYSSQTLPTANFDAGLYFIIFKGNSGLTSSKRFLIER